MRECLGPSSPAQLVLDADRGRGELEGEGRRDEMSFRTHGEQPKADDRAEDPGFDTGAAQERDGDGGREDWFRGGGSEWGHRGMVCSQCCVERGADGEVRCLGCLRAEKGG
jgi:hypothetical protein